MSNDTLSLPTDPEELRAFAAALQGQLVAEKAARAAEIEAHEATKAQLVAAKASIQVSALQIEKLKVQLARLRRMKFGQSSERVTEMINQLELTLEDMETEQAVDLAIIEAAMPVADLSAKPKRQPKRLPLPEHLPRKNVVHVAPDADGCSACGGDMGALGEDVTEVLEYVPARFHVVRHVRPKMACKKCDAISQAPAPALPIPRGRAGPKLLSHILVSKYADHLPLYRQSEIFAREGVALERSTLADWVGQVSWLLQPLVERIAKHVFASEKIHTDDIPVPVLAPGSGKTKTGRIWVYARDNRKWNVKDPPAAVYYFSPDRKAEHPKAHLRNYAGFLQADGYPGYEQLYAADRQPGPLIEVACWAHVRRKIYDVWKADSKSVASEGVEIIRQLYARHELARKSDPNVRGDPWKDVNTVGRTFFAWADKVLGQISAKTPLAEALRYAVTRKTALLRFTQDPRLEIDNNRAENSVRAIALGRKNYLFAGSNKGGERGAAIYSLIETARLNGVNAQVWLADVLQRVADGHPINRLDELLPWNWKKAFGAEADAQARMDQSSPISVTGADLAFAAEVKATAKARAQSKSAAGLLIGGLDSVHDGRHMGHVTKAGQTIVIRVAASFGQRPLGQALDIEALIESEGIWLRIGEVYEGKHVPSAELRLYGTVDHALFGHSASHFACHQRDDGGFDLTYVQGQVAR